jgi:hypothetical protein
LFHREDYRKRATTPEKSVLGSSPGEDIFYILENDARRTKIRPELFVSARRLQEQKL